ncbi:WYL domain-containing protein [Capnocytophaga canimorsus]|uniref:WYL domain-containing protein n=1 Tax=Capnocytophaga canimorsus TaxID=28188 RepID=UPI0037CD8114
MTSCERNYQAVGTQRRLHRSQKEIKTEDNYTFFEYFLRPTYDFRQEILSHGAEIEVISPNWFREEIQQIVAEMHKFYS